MARGQSSESNHIRVYSDMAYRSERTMNHVRGLKLRNLGGLRMRSAPIHARGVQTRRQKSRVRKTRRQRGGQTQEQLNNFLLDAAQRGDKDDVLSYLRVGADINALNLDRRTPLSLAIYKNNHNLAMAIIKWANHGGRSKSVELHLDTKDKNGQTPIYYAAYNGDIDLVKALIDGGADIHAKDKYGQTLLLFLTMNKPDEDVMEFIEVIKLTPKIVNTSDNIGDSTPLHWAARQGLRRVAEALIDAGANIHAKNISGKTPLDLANDMNRESIVKLLEAAASRPRSGSRSRSRSRE
jgi:ankyrin repeat protein